MATENNHIPDIRIEPIREGVAMVSSSAMQFEAPVKVVDLSMVVLKLTIEYQDLIDAGMVSVPVWDSTCGSQ